MAGQRKFPCNVFIDESSEGEHDFTVIGGVVSPDGVCGRISEEIQACKKHPSTEVKWNWIDNRNFQLYRRIVDVASAHAQKDNLHFHCLVIENKKVDYNQYSFGSIDLGFNKFIYQIVLKFARKYARFGNLYVYPDQRRTLQTGEDFRQVLNNGGLLHPEVKVAPFKLVEFRKSGDVPLIQLSDVLIGAVAYEVNQQDLRPNACKGKLEVLKHIKQSFGLATFRRSTPIKESRFNIWHFDFSKARK